MRFLWRWEDIDRVVVAHLSGAPVAPVDGEALRQALRARDRVEAVAP